MSHHLSWNLYSDHLREMLQEMFVENSFTDVTLVCDDKKQIEAHRNILSACSPVFKDMLLTEKSSKNHPVIYLRGIQSPEMEAILQFIYQGQATLHQEKMIEFLLVARNLEIKELSKDAAVDSIESVELENGINEETKMATDEDLKEGKQYSVMQTEELIVEDSYTEHRDSSREEKSMDTVGHNEFQCGECDKIFDKKSTLKKHLRAGHEEEKYVCNLCKQRFPQQNSFLKHMLTSHESIKYICKHECGYEAISQYNLDFHESSVHEKVEYSPFHLLKNTANKKDNKSFSVEQEGRKQGS